MQGQPPSLNLENKVPLSVPVGKGRGSFSHLETLNCRSRLFLDRKMLNVVQKDEAQYLLSSVSKSYRIKECVWSYSKKCSGFTKEILSLVKHPMLELSAVQVSQRDI